MKEKRNPENERKHQHLKVNNDYGEFKVKVGDEIACYPYFNVFFRVVGLFDNIDPNVITVITDDNLYDTRLATHIHDVR